MGRLVANDVHPNVNVRDQVSSGDNFKFVSSAEAVHAAKNNVRFAERTGFLLPSLRNNGDVGIRLKAIDRPQSDMHLWRVQPRINDSRPDKPIEIGFLDNVVVVDDVALEADVRQLLNDMRPAAAKSNAADDASFDADLRIRTKKTLAVAAALRMVQSCKYPVFVAFSSDGCLSWYSASKAANDYYYFKKPRTSLDGESLARTCTTDLQDA